MAKRRPIQILRDRLAISQEEMAKRLGVRQASVSRWEQGKREMIGPVKILIQRLLEDTEAEAAE